MEQLEAILNENQYIRCDKVGEEDFHDYGQFEDKIYKSTPLTGHTKKYQVFYSDELEMGILYGKESNLLNATTHRMDLRKGTEADRKAILKEFRDYFDEKEEVLQRLVPPGIRTIKQVELYSKWRKHVPDEHKSPLYDNPGEDVLKSIKDDRRSKKEYIAARRQLEQEAESSGKKLHKKQ
jgi:hypothetical protein